MRARVPTGGVAAHSPGGLLIGEDEEDVVALLISRHRLARSDMLDRESKSAVTT